MPPIPPEELIPKFESELAKVSGTAYRAHDLQDLEGHLKSILAQSDAGIVLSRNPLLARLGLAEKLQAWGKTVAVWSQGAEDADAAGDSGFRERAFAADVGITGVDFVLAESGTLVLSSATEGAQLASLAPPVHVALYRREQVLGSLEEVLERLPVPRKPDEPVPGRAVVFVTGPSRTADIEQILIRGVHGPREVHAILVEDGCLV
jgi:L-lactate dehydrogenase complex protein LldG